MDQQEFNAKYNQAFNNTMKYTSNQAGSKIYLDEMVKLSEEYPEWTEELENNAWQGTFNMQ